MNSDLHNRMQTLMNESNARMRAEFDSLMPIEDARAWRDHFAREMGVKLGERNVEVAALKEMLGCAYGVAFVSLVINGIFIAKMIL